MVDKTKIEWTDSTWNPVTGCTKISQGCKFCYAETMANRLKKMGVTNYKDGFEVKLHKDSLTIPLTINKPRMIFVNSMSDLFHEKVPDDFIFSVFEVMNKAYWHVFQVLTKRPERMVEISQKVKLTNNIWLGVSVENNQTKGRIDYLRSIQSNIRFISFEPLLEKIDNPNLENIDWVIVGGESGRTPRPIEADWVRSLRDICIEKQILFFFKQWGGTNKKKAGRLLDGVIWDQTPKIVNK